MAALRWIPHSRVSMQRIGMPVIAAALSSRRAVTLERAARELLASVQRKTSVPRARREEVERYLQSLRLWKRYADLRGGRSLADDDLLEVQDLWLADEALPAATGAITPEVADDIPQLAVSLRLVRDRNFTRTDRGNALLSTLTEAATKPLAKSAKDTVPNPLLPGRSTQLLLLYALLEADGDFIATAYEMSESAQRAEFKRGEFADELSAVCRELVRRHRSAMRTSHDRKLLARLEEWAVQIDRPRGSGPKWGGGRPPEQLATLRLEPLVDLGIVTRLDRYAYRYRLDENQRAFFRRLAGARDIATFVTEDLVAAWRAATTGAAQHQRLSSDEAWPYVVEAYDRMRSPLGQAPFTEVALVAIGGLIESESNRYFEIADAVEAISCRRLEDPKHVRMGINRRGQVTYMKLS